MDIFSKIIDMKIQIASDLHLEQRQRNLPNPEDFKPVSDRDVLVLAGDIGTHTGARDFVLRELEISPVIYVPGNHEYYSEWYREETDDAWRLLDEENADLHYLVAESVTLGGVRFCGAPWYTDFWKEKDPYLLRYIGTGINDFSEWFNDRGNWTVARHVEQNRRQTEWLREQAGKVDVVVTHWPPSRQSIHPRFDGSPLNPYFVNDYDDLVREVAPKVWISGHTHEASEYRLGETLCVGNPTGYPGEPRDLDIFRVDRTVEI